MKSNKWIFKLLWKNEHKTTTHTNNTLSPLPASVLAVAPTQVFSLPHELVSVLATVDYEASHHKMTLTVAYCEHEGIPEYADTAGGPSPVEKQHNW